MEDRLTELVRDHGYLRMETPVVEHAELFARKLGGERLAQTYQFGFRGRDLALRPEHTASVVRAYVETMQSDPLPIRLSYAGPVFRYESPQAGRSRQFLEFGCELIGADSLLADTETILLALSCVRAAGVEQPALVLGHIGVVLGFLDQLALDHRTQDWLIWSMERIRRGEPDATAIPSHLIRDDIGFDAPDGIETLDREAVVDLLRQSGVDFEAGSRSAEEIVDGLFDKRRRGADSRVLEGAVAFVEALIDAAGSPRTAIPRLRALVEQRRLDTGPIDELSEICRILEASGFDPDGIKIDLGLGRGLRYYTGMLFEIYAGSPDGLQIAGGGRYDDLARQLGARNQVPSAGFSIGLERLLMAGRVAGTDHDDYRVLVLTGPDPADTFRLTSQLRDTGWTAIVDTRGRSENAARRWAARNGFTAVAARDGEGARFFICADGRELTAESPIGPDQAVTR